jgi:ferrochelatase
MAGDRVAVLLMAYGGPASLADVEPYLLEVRGGGRATSPDFVEEVRQRYARIGGRSPILELTRAQATGVASALGDGFGVYVGMRHWHPYIRETVDEIVRAGHRRLVGIVMAPHYSSMSVGAYEKQLLEAAQGRLETALVRNWADHPRFLDAVASRVTEGLQRFRGPSAVQVIFTAHSLPQRILASGDPYPDELRASAAAVARRQGLADWHLAYQSAGATAEPWLGPDAGELISDLAAQGHDAFLLVPIGFVCDHVEILYDIDIKYHALAAGLGVQLERTASLNDDPELAAALADVARTAARQHGWR